MGWAEDEGFDGHDFLDAGDINFFDYYDDGMRMSKDGMYFKKKRLSAEERLRLENQLLRLRLWWESQKEQ
jgi:hypothetical protein